LRLSFASSIESLGWRGGLMRVIASQLAAKKPVTILRKNRFTPNVLVNRHADKPSVQKVEVKLLRNESFAANSVQDLQAPCLQGISSYKGRFDPLEFCVRFFQVLKIPLDRQILIEAALVGPQSLLHRHQLGKILVIVQ
jgi:hypothetical protein